jgi:hypothetical protein
LAFANVLKRWGFFTSNVYFDDAFDSPYNGEGDLTVHICIPNMMLFYLPAGMWEEFSNFFHSSFLEKL